MASLRKSTASSVYSTQVRVFGPSLQFMRSLAQAAPDSMLAFEIGGQIFVRRHSLRFEVRPRQPVLGLVALPRHYGRNRDPPHPNRTYPPAQNPQRDRLHRLGLRLCALPRYAPGYTAAAQKTARPRRPTQRWAAPCAATERPKCSTPGPIPISMTPTAPFPPGVMQSMLATASGIAKLYRRIKAPARQIFLDAPGTFWYNTVLWATAGIQPAAPA